MIYLAITYIDTPYIYVASPVAQMVKNLPAMWETLVGALS